MGHGAASEEEFADIDAVKRTVVLVGSGSAHQELARRNAGKIRWEGGVL
jgi:hypothetical protein